MTEEHWLLECVRCLAYFMSPAQVQGALCPECERKTMRGETRCTKQERTHG